MKIRITRTKSRYPTLQPETRIYISFQTQWGKGKWNKNSGPDVLVQEDQTRIPPSPEYSPGNSGENIKIQSCKIENHVTKKINID